MVCGGEVVRWCFCGCVLYFFGGLVVFLWWYKMLTLERYFESCGRDLSRTLS